MTILSRIRCMVVLNNFGRIGMDNRGPKIRTILGLVALMLALELDLDASAKTALQVDRMFSDNMVLQSGMAVPVWGTSDAGEGVVVKFQGQTKTTKADKDGNWMLKLDPLKNSSEGHDFIVFSSADNQQLTTFHDVVVGEVWIGSGQSNMAGATGGYRKNDEVLDSWANGAINMSLRFYDRDKRVWLMPSDQTINSFSALSFSFMFSLSKELGMPVGMMVVAHDGNPSGKWITPEMAVDSGNTILKKLVEGVPEKSPVNSSNQGKDTFLNRETMGVHYLNQISKFRPFAIRGVLWDQGEAGTAIEGLDQFSAMSALIKGWRQDWGQDFAFLHMQKPSGGGCAWDPEDPINLRAESFRSQPKSPWAKPDRMFYALDHIRMGTIPNAPMVPTMDLAPGIHPSTKSAYGSRACRVALGAVYGRDVEICGPVYRAHKVDGNMVLVAFNHVGKGLAFRHGEKLQGFELAGEDGKWYWAEATIPPATGSGQKADTVVLQSAAVPKPINVRYAFDPKPSFANLFNKDGLPALPFTTEKLSLNTRPSFGRNQ